jgi:translation initiation factor IF-2
MNVTELYRELKMTKDDFFAKVQELGFDIGERAIKIDDAVAVKIISAIKQQRKALNKKSIFAEATDTPAVEAETDSRAKPLLLPDKVTVKVFAEKLGKRVPEMISILIRNGIMATINQTLDYETAAIIAEDLGYRPELSLEEAGIDNVDDRAVLVSDALAAEAVDALVERPPVVVIMGHVDHGKTTLLDSIRSTSVTAGESGGITQHIGTYQVTRRDKLITFIDTPGHEAFTTMRSRGARVADVAILVVAADDGIKPQTIESIHILQEGELPFVVAINKIDKPEADIDRVKKELSELNLVPEDYGGTTICVPVSAKSGEHIDDLLDTVLLLSDVEKKSITANPNGQTVGSVIESHVDKHMGPVATILVQNGTLRIGDSVQIGSIPGRVRALHDWTGQEVETAPPSMPVQVLGLKKAPVVGDILQVVTDKKLFKKQVKAYDSFSFLRARPKQSESEDGKKKLTLIIRADKLGSLEAIIQSLQNIEHKEVGIDVIHKGLGSITDADVALAASSGAIVLGFHAAITSGAEKFARDEQIVVQRFEVIYQLIDFIKEQLTGLLDAAVSYERIGSLTILAVFRREQTYVVCGGRVTDGVIKMKAPLKLVRSGAMIGEGTLSQLQQDKKNVSEVKKNTECGMKIETDAQVQEGDVVECYVAVETARTLDV